MLHAQMDMSQSAACSTWLWDGRQPWPSLHPDCWSKGLIARINGVRDLLWLPSQMNTSHHSGSVQGGGRGGEWDTAEDCSPGHACSPLWQTALYTTHTLVIQIRLYSSTPVWSTQHHGKSHEQEKKKKTTCIFLEKFHLDTVFNIDLP